LKEVEGSDLENYEDGEADGKLPQMKIGNGSLKANIKGKVKSQCQENRIRTKKKQSSLEGTPFDQFRKRPIQRSNPFSRVVVFPSSHPGNGIDDLVFVVWGVRGNASWRGIFTDPLFDLSFQRYQLPIKNLF